MQACAPPFVLTVSRSQPKPSTLDSGLYPDSRLLTLSERLHQNFRVPGAPGLNLRPGLTPGYNP